VAAAPLKSDFGRERWTQLNLDGPILEPELPWEGCCIEAAAMARHDGRLYMFYAGSYNNAPQQVGVAASDDGVHFARLFDEPLLPAGPPGSWNSSESGHPFLFQDDDGRDYLFYQGNNDKGRTWYLSVVPIDWQDGKPVPAPEELLASIRRQYQERLAKTLKQRGLKRPEELYGYWRRTLKPTGR